MGKSELTGMFKCAVGEQVMSTPLDMSEVRADGTGQCCVAGSRQSGSGGGRRADAAVQMAVKYGLLGQCSHLRERVTWRTSEWEGDAGKPRAAQPHSFRVMLTKCNC